MNSIDNASFSLKGKVIVVTGGTGVLGYAMIKGIVANGGTVGILGRKQPHREQSVFLRGNMISILLSRRVFGSQSILHSTSSTRS